MTSTTDRQTYYYFGYGSYLNTLRMHMNDPTAKMVAVAKLEDFKLVFGLTLGRNEKASTWKGAGASIEESPGSHVWGIVWEIQKTETWKIDRLNGADHYNPFAVYVTPENSEEKIRCRAYRYRPPLKPWRPSPIYMKAMIDGARENNIPKDYIQMLETVKDNGVTNVTSKCYQKYLRLRQEHIEMK